MDNSDNGSTDAALSDLDGPFDDAQSVEELKREIRLQLKGMDTPDFDTLLHRIDTYPKRTDPELDKLRMQVEQNRSERFERAKAEAYRRLEDPRFNLDQKRKAITVALEILPGGDPKLGDELEWLVDDTGWNANKLRVVFEHIEWGLNKQAFDSITKHLHWVKTEKDSLASIQNTLGDLHPQWTKLRDYSQSLEALDREFSRQMDLVNNSIRLKRDFVPALKELEAEEKAGRPTYPNPDTGREEDINITIGRVYEEYTLSVMYVVLGLLIRVVEGDWSDQIGEDGLNVGSKNLREMLRQGNIPLRLAGGHPLAQIKESLKKALCNLKPETYLREFPDIRLEGDRSLDPNPTDIRHPQDRADCVRIFEMVETLWELLNQVEADWQAQDKGLEQLLSLYDRWPSSDVMALMTVDAQEEHNSILDEWAQLNEGHQEGYIWSFSWEEYEETIKEVQDRTTNSPLYKASGGDRVHPYEQLKSWREEYDRWLAQATRWKKQWASLNKRRKKLDSTFDKLETLLVNPKAKQSQINAQLRGARRILKNLEEAKVGTEWEQQRLAELELQHNSRVNESAFYNELQKLFAQAQEQHDPSLWQEVFAKAGSRYGAETDGDPPQQYWTEGRKIFLVAQVHYMVDQTQSPLTREKSEVKRIERRIEHLTTARQAVAALRAPPHNYSASPTEIELFDSIPKLIEQEEGNQKHAHEIDKLADGLKEEIGTLESKRTDEYSVQVEITMRKAIFYRNCAKNDIVSVLNKKDTPSDLAARLRNYFYGTFHDGWWEALDVAITLLTQSTEAVLRTYLPAFSATISDFRGYYGARKPLTSEATDQVNKFRKWYIADVQEQHEALLLKEEVLTRLVCPLDVEEYVEWYELLPQVKERDLRAQVGAYCLLAWAIKRAEDDKDRVERLRAVVQNEPEAFPDKLGWGKMRREVQERGTEEILFDALLHAIFDYVFPHVGLDERKVPGVAADAFDRLDEYLQLADDVLRGASMKYNNVGRLWSPLFGALRLIVQDRGAKRNVQPIFESLDDLKSIMDSDLKSDLVWYQCRLEWATSPYDQIQSMMMADLSPRSVQQLVLDLTALDNPGDWGAVVERLRKSLPNLETIVEQLEARQTVIIGSELAESLVKAKNSIDYLFRQVQFILERLERLIISADIKVSKEGRTRLQQLQQHLGDDDDDAPGAAADDDPNPRAALRSALDFYEEARAKLKDVLFPRHERQVSGETWSLDPVTNLFDHAENAVLGLKGLPEKWGAKDYRYDREQFDEINTLIGKLQTTIKDVVDGLKMLTNEVDVAEKLAAIREALDGIPITCHYVQTVLKDLGITEEFTVPDKYFTTILDKPLRELDVQARLSYRDNPSLRRLLIDKRVVDDSASLDEGQVPHEFAKYPLVSKVEGEFEHRFVVTLLEDRLARWQGAFDAFVGGYEETQTRWSQLYDWRCYLESVGVAMESVLDEANIQSAKNQSVGWPSQDDFEKAYNTLVVLGLTVPTEVKVVGNLSGLPAMVAGFQGAVAKWQEGFDEVFWGADTLPAELIRLVDTVKLELNGIEVKIGAMEESDQRLSPIVERDFNRTKLALRNHLQDRQATCQDLLHAYSAVSGYARFLADTYSHIRGRAGKAKDQRKKIIEIYKALTQYSREGKSASRLILDKDWNHADRTAAYHLGHSFE